MAALAAMCRRPRTGPAAVKNTCCRLDFGPLPIVKTRIPAALAVDGRGASIRDLRAGKHLPCEKPRAIGLEEALELQSVVARAPAANEFHQQQPGLGKCNVRLLDRSSGV
jgi:hypothetical protein